MTKTAAHIETEGAKAYEEGYQAAIQDAKSGLLRNSGIHATRHVQDFIDIYKTAIRQSIENDIKGVYRMGSGSGCESRLADKVIAEADEKFTGILDPRD